jgi:hypothetical protein
MAPGSSDVSGEPVVIERATGLDPGIHDLEE